MTANFTAYIDSTFTGVEALKAELIATATAMFGCGWVWLAFDQSHNLRILCTYNAGTPYGASHRRQSTDMNTGATLGSTADAYTSPLRRAAQGTQASWVIPVLNVNCWEHVWVEDFGVMGKETYLEAWWNRIDWSVVQSRCPNKASPRAFAES
jgi:Fe-Mn family superoxide dismutase